ncbi:MAG: HutP family protein [bacterium]|nr:HutP family protein [bacterium]
MTVRLSIQVVLYTGEEISVGKAALALAMGSNEYDDCLVSLLEAKGCRAVVTRAGGRGDNLKDKMLRNTLSAAENSGVIKDLVGNRYALAQCVERAMKSFESPLMDISGAGVKIGVVVKDADVAVAIYGTVGVPGLDVDREISGLGVERNALIT